MTVLAEGPIQRNFKVCVISRPPSQVHFLGCTNSKGDFKPGLLHLLRRLVLDEFLAKLRAEDLASFPKTMIFFRSSDAMSRCNSFLIEKTGLRTLDTTPFVMNHSSLSSSDEEVIGRRRDQYQLILTTNRELLLVFHLQNFHDSASKADSCFTPEVLAANFLGKYLHKV